MLKRVRSAFCLTLAATATFATGSRSQCATHWLPGPPLVGCDNVVTAMTEWDPDGAGPRTSVLVLGGGFTAAGDVAANHIVTFDPATAAWSMLGSGITGSFQFAAVRVFALAVLPNGDLVAGGAFTTAGGVPASCIARWDGTAWSPLGSGMDGAVLALRVMPNGDLVAGGRFTTAGGVPAAKAARWNGVAWSALGAGPGVLASDSVYAFAVRNGDLVAACTTPGGPTSNPVVRWNGVAWSPVGPGLTGAMAALTTLPNGDLLAGGGVGVLRWNGITWASFGPPLPSVAALCRLASGEVVAAGATGVHRGNGTSWTPVGTLAYPGGSPEAVTQLGNGMVIVGGTFDAIDGVRMHCVGAWNGASWSPLGASPGPLATSAATCMPNGDVVVASTPFAGGSVRVQRWNGVSWSQLGGVFDAGVACLATAANGDVLASGSFTAIGGVPAARVARWNGAAWQPLGAGTDARVNRVHELANGHVLALGAFVTAGGVPANGIARWDGTSWSPIAGGLPFEAFTVVEAANGDLLVGGNGSPRVMRWNGAVWSAVGALVGQVEALVELANGDLVVGGTNLVSGTTVLHHIGRWNGTAWLPLGSGIGAANSYDPPVKGLVALPGGDVIAVGNFVTAGGVPARGAARWNGATWTPLATASTGFPQSVVRAPNGDLVLSGVMRIDDVVSAGFARLTTTCPAMATASGTGCDGDTLVATNLPWTGSVFAARASGLPATALALDGIGLSTAAIPLAAVLPQGGAGCSLAVSPDLLGALLPAAGAVTTQLAIPNSSVLAGAVLHQQVLTLGLDAGGAITTFTSSNRLTLTIGTY
jgi:hypothetical protein